MGNEQIFKALSSPTRIKILKILSLKELHITGLAKEVGISKPVTSRHIKILEKVGLIEKKIIGNVHILNPKMKNIEKALEPFIVQSKVEIEKEKSIFNALKQVPGIEIKKIGKHRYIKSIDGDDGYYIYEVNGNLPRKPINEFIIRKKTTIDLKKLISVNKKNISIEIKKKK
jgi:DNA-binding transcriptional ArsR family regulator